MGAAFVPALVQAATCEIPFADGVQTFGAGGEVTFNWRASLINSPDDIVETDTLNDNNTHPSDESCDDVDCTHSGSPSTAGGAVTVATGSGGDGSISFASGSRTAGGASSNYPGNDFSSVSISNSADLEFTADYTEYYLGGLSATSSNQLTLAPGDYYIDGNFDMLNSGQLIVSSGTVRIWVTGNINITSSSQINMGGTADQLLMYSEGNASIGSQVDMNGFVYAQGDVSFLDRAELTGAAAAGSSVSLLSRADVTYDQTAALNAEFGDLCGTAVVALPTLVAEYRMNEAAYTGASGEVLDSSSNGLNGQAINGLTTATANPAIAGDPGTCGYGDFAGNGSNHLIEVADNATLDLADSLSVTVWVNPNSLPGSGLMSILSKDENYEFHLTSSGAVNWWWRDSGGTARSFNSTATVSASNSGANNGWHHVAIVYESGSQTIYVDGVAAGSQSYTGQLMLNNDPLQIGADQNYGGRYFNGQIDEVRIYSGALTASQVATVMAETQPCSSNTCYTFSDTFSSASFAGSSGTGGWATNWIEVGENDGASAGNVWVLTSGSKQGLQLRSTSFFGNDREVYRQADLSAFDSITLNVQYIRDLDAAGDIAQIAVSDDGGSNYTVLESFEGPVTDGGYQTASYDISAYASSNFRLRFSSIDFTDWFFGTDDFTVGEMEIEACTTAASSIDHLEVDFGSASASTCSPKAVTIRACVDSAVPCTTLKDDYTGTVTISTSSNHGDWSINDANGTLNPNPHTADDGAVQYTFVDADDGDVVLDLTNTHADDLTITVTDAAASETVVSGTIQFRDNAFVITPDPVTVAGKDQTMTVTAYQRDGTDCAVMTAYDGNNLPFKAWLTRDASIDPGGTAPTVGGASLPNSQPGANNIQLNFSSGVASLVMVTTDVGKYTLELLDDSRVFATGTDIAGATASDIVTRPFGLDIDFSDDRANNGISGVSYAANLGGSPFAAAGANFSTTVTGVLWQSVDDTNNDGVPDASADLSNNSPAPSFGAEGGGYGASVTLLPTIVLPGGGSDGVLTNNTFSSYINGADTRNMQWNNVGIIDMAGSLSNYMNSGETVTGSVSNVGRFYPGSFALTGPTLGNGCGTFSYLDEPSISASFTLQALSLDGLTVLSNYDESLGYSPADDPSYHAENNDDGDDKASRVGGFSDESWSAGSYSVSASSVVFARPASGLEAPLTDLQIGVAYDDSDAQLSGNDMNASTTGDCSATNSCSEVSLGSIETRFGRLRLQDAFGPETAPLPIYFATEYYNGSDWVFNGEDSCSEINLVLVDLDGASAPAAGTFTGVSVGGGSTDGTHNVSGGGQIQINNGSSGFTFSAPGQGNTGSFPMDVSSVPDWLRFDWDQDGTHDDADLPQATITFGSYRGHDRIINWIEVLP